MGGRFRLGLRGEILIAFALVTLFAIGLNTGVVWRLNLLLLRAERLEEARTAGRLVSTALGAEAGTDAVARRLVDEVPGVMAVAFFGPSGNLVGRSGDSAEADSEAVRRGELRAVTGLGETRATILEETGAGLARSLEGRVIRVTTPLSAPSRSSGEFPGSPSGGSTGAVTVWLEVGAPRAAERQARRLALFYVVLNALVVGGFGWYLVSRTVVRPVGRLLDGTRRVAGGDLQTRVPPGGANELGDLARDFNRMTETLAQKDEAIVRQLRELESANQSLREAREEVLQSEKLASVGRLAAGVAHELGNPVAAVTGYVSALLRPAIRTAAQSGEAPNPAAEPAAAAGAATVPVVERAGPETVEVEMLRRIEGEMRRVDRIIRDLLDYARPRDEAMAPLDVDEIVDGALSIVRVQKGFNQVELERARPPDPLPKVLGDPHRLQQVIVNLLINAADAVEAGPERRIHVETSRSEFPAPPAERRRREDPALPDGPAVAIRVEDSGVGIPPENLKLLFDPFFTTKAPGRGTGLGLAIARPIVESMGGRILATSESNRGSTFTVLLPVPPAG